MLILLWLCLSCCGSDLTVINMRHAVSCLQHAACSFPKTRIEAVALRLSFSSRRLPKGTPRGVGPVVIYNIVTAQRSTGVWKCVSRGMSTRHQAWCLGRKSAWLPAGKVICSTATSSTAVVEEQGTRGGSYASMDQAGLANQSAQCSPSSSLCWVLVGIGDAPWHLARLGIRDSTRRNGNVGETGAPGIWGPRKEAGRKEGQQPRFCWQY